MQFTFLGTAGSWPTKERSTAAIVVATEPELLLFDCGEGTQRQFFQSTMSFMRVRRVFISHFHGDHFLGLPGLIQSMCLNGRHEPLDLYGPDGAEEMFQRALHLGTYTLRFPVAIHTVAPETTIEQPGYTVRAARADHPVPALAFRLEEAPKRGRFDAERARALGIHGRDFSRLEAGERVHVDGRIVEPSDVMGPPRPGRSFVYSGDTAPSEDVRRLARGATVLVHEATTAADLEAEANRWGHSSARQAATIARDAEAVALLLNHFSSRYKDIEPLEAEARTVFPATTAARDLDHRLIRQP